MVNRPREDEAGDSERILIRGIAYCIISWTISLHGQCTLLSSDASLSPFSDYSVCEHLNCHKRAPWVGTNTDNFQTNHDTMKSAETRGVMVAGSQEKQISAKLALGQTSAQYIKTNQWLLLPLARFVSSRSSRISHVWVFVPRYRSHGTEPFPGCGESLATPWDDPTAFQRIPLGSVEPKPERELHHYGTHQCDVLGQIN